MSLAEYKAIIFDCYGTLIDWETGMYQAFRPLLSTPDIPDKKRLFELFGQYESMIQTETPSLLYPQVQVLALSTVFSHQLTRTRLAEAYRRLALAIGHSTQSGEAEAFGHSIEQWQCYPDTCKALSQLKNECDMTLTILSNVDRESFSRTRLLLEQGDWGCIDAVFTAEEIGTYKPDPKNMNFALKRIRDDFSIALEDTLVVAVSLFHDVKPANDLGMKSVWIARHGSVLGIVDDGGGKPDWVFPDMKSFADAMLKAKSG
ncbi:hypothetical protein P7C73_g5675, partial [Tremellales sp. Uapishka_1]